MLLFPCTIDGFAVFFFDLATRKLKNCAYRVRSQSVLPVISGVVFAAATNHHFSNLVVSDYCKTWWLR
ncbi:hypothetical protein GQ457_08G000130 [Hibiscus cannabinus]